jgi:hypothetical protein
LSSQPLQDSSHCKPDFGKEMFWISFKLAYMRIAYHI